MLIACQQLFLTVTDLQIATAGEVPPLQTHTPVCINERGLHNSARSKPSTASLLQSDTIVPFMLPDLFSSLAKRSAVKITITIPQITLPASRYTEHCYIFINITTCLHTEAPIQTYITQQFNKKPK